MANQLKATEQYFPLVLVFIMVYKVVITFESVDGTLKCDFLLVDYKFSSTESFQIYVVVILLEETKVIKGIKYQNTCPWERQRSFYPQYYSTPCLHTSS